MLPNFESLRQTQEKHIRILAENGWGELMISMVLQHLCKQGGPTL